MVSSRSAGLLRLFFDEARYPEEAAALRLLALRDGTTIFGVDLAAPADAVASLVAARRAGKTAAVLPILGDPYENWLSTILQTIAAGADHDQRMVQLRALATDQLMVNGVKPSELAAYPPPMLDALALTTRLADVILLQAPGERERWATLLGRPLRRFALLPVDAVRSSLAGGEAGLTLYAPSTPRTALAAYEQLLQRSRIAYELISAENASAAIGTRVVLAPEWRALRARTLAARGHHVVTPSVVRVAESDERILGYAPSDFRSLLSSVDAAFCSAEGERNVADATPATVAETIARETARALDGPRTSIVIRTFDRPALLRRAVASVAAQTYRDVEIVVVNNGGDDVRDAVLAAAAGRPVVYERMPERKHISSASNVGARAATGTYIGYLDDDDLLYADHCARAVDVLERTKADIAFTMCLGEYAEMNGETKRLLGYQIFLDRDFDPDGIYVLNVTPIHTVVHPRSLFERFGYFDETLPVTDDWELWLRVSHGGGRFVRIDRVTCEYSWRYDSQRGNMSVDHQWDFANAYRSITQRYGAAVAARPSLRMEQASTLAQQEQRAQAAADPANRAAIVIGSMSSSIVPVTPIPELFH
jgi:GT2 family glycosyltransferase